MSAATPLPLIGPKQDRAEGGFLWETVVNGPVRSRRLGVSLGLNLLPLRSKICSFDCPYCECGFNTERRPGSRWPSPDEVAHSLARALERLPAPPDWITFSGNGEPTLHPRFGVAVDRVLAIRDAAAPRTRAAILSNGLLAAHAAVRAALMRLDARILKLDPGPPERVNRAGYDAAGLARAYRAVKPYTLQAMVVKGADFDGSSDASLERWVSRVVEADPDAVQIYSIERPPADGGILNVPRERLEVMAINLRGALPRVPVEVF
ncbi:MAG: radical SAM protein [Gemmatimonadales bacterium]